MRTLLIAIFILSFCMNSYSQNLDLIVTNQNDSIICRIDSVTDSNIFYRDANENNKVIYGFQMIDIESYTYDFVSEIQYLLKYTNKYSNRENDGTYKYLRKKYAKIPYKTRESDRYSPDAAGFLALIPGVGHIYTGEPLRGLAFFGGMVGSFWTMVGGFAMAWDGSPLGAPFFFAGAAGVVIFYIWNIFDAVQVAKVKNLALRNNDISLRLLPNVEFSTAYNQPANNFGVRLVINF